MIRTRDFITTEGKFDGPLMRKHRLALDLTQNAFGARLGISAGYVCQMETGVREPSSETLGRMVTYLRAMLARDASHVPVSAPAPKLRPQPSVEHLYLKENA